MKGFLQNKKATGFSHESTSCTTTECAELVLRPHFSFLHPRHGAGRAHPCLSNERTLCTDCSSPQDLGQLQVLPTETPPFLLKLLTRSTCIETGDRQTLTKPAYLENKHVFANKHLALLLNITRMRAKKKKTVELKCTYDISN